MIISLKRIARNGWKDFTRNFGLSFASIFITLMVIFLLTFLFIFNSSTKVLMATIQQKMDISVYFKKEATVDEVFVLKEELSQMPDVQDVEYVSCDQALETFVERHKDDPVLMDSITELGDNPFLASLNIKSWQASQYEQVANFLEQGQYKDLIEKIDYHQRKPVIDRLFTIISGINSAAGIFTLVLGIIAVLVAFNTIKISIQGRLRFQVCRKW